MRLIIPTVKTWCLPGSLGEKDLEDLHNGIVNIMINFPEAGVDSESDMLNLFPPDSMTYGLGSEIKIEITDIPQCDQDVRDKLSAQIGEFVKSLFSQANVFCKVECANMAAGYWSSM